MDWLSGLTSFSYVFPSSSQMLVVIVLESRPLLVHSLSFQISLFIMTDIWVFWDVMLWWWVCVAWFLQGTSKKKLFIDHSDPWQWRNYVHMQHWETPTQGHSMTASETWILITYQAHSVVLSVPASHQDSQALSTRLASLSAALQLPSPEHAQAGAIISK
jgi:hypothetical protein